MTEDAKSEFARLAAMIWGFGYQTKASRHFNVADRTVRRWCSGDSIVPEGVLRELREIVQIPPPPAGTTENDDRDDDCCDAIEPAINQLCERAVANGWSLAEVLTAMLSITVSELKVRAGDQATRQTLQAAIMMMDE